jgi:hypothetical protein
MNYLVIYPGRFQPFHLGHKASYEYLTKLYGDNAVYIATSDVTDPETSPFTYSDKVQMATKLGIPSNHIVQVKNPYRADEIVNQLPAEEKAGTALIFAVSAKDSERFTFKPKKDGSPSYLQPLPKNIKKLKPMTQCAYVQITPTVNFKVKDVDADSATRIRELYREGNNADRTQIITDLYGTPDVHLRELFDQKLGTGEPEVNVAYGSEGIYAGDAPGQVMRERREKLMAKITEMREQLAHFRRLNLNEQTIIDYVDEKR